MISHDIQPALSKIRRGKKLRHNYQYNFLWNQRYKDNSILVTCSDLQLPSCFLSEACEMTVYHAGLLTLANTLWPAQEPFQGLTILHPKAISQNFTQESNCASNSLGQTLWWSLQRKLLCPSLPDVRSPTGGQDSRKASLSPFCIRNPPKVGHTWVYRNFYLTWEFWSSCIQKNTSAKGKEQSKK